jgi:protein CpxP
MKSSRFLIVIIIVLVLVNIITLAIMWKGQNHGEEHMPPRGPKGAFDFLTKELNLDEKQMSEFKMMDEKLHKTARTIQEKNHKMHYRFFNLLKISPVDTAASARLIDSMTMCQSQMEILTFNHFRKVRAICTPEQQKKFDEVINKALEIMAPHPPRGPRGNDGPPPEK